MTPLIPIALTLFLLFFVGMAGFAAAILALIARGLLSRLRSRRGIRPVCLAGPIASREQRLARLQALAALTQHDHP